MFSYEEEQLKKLKASYEREKQFATVIEKLEDTNETNNSELKAFEEQISSLEKKIKISKKIIKEETEKMEKAKKELIVLWKIEIDSTISRKRETLELPEETNETQVETEEIKDVQKNFFTKLKKVKAGKHACT